MVGERRDVFLQRIQVTNIVRVLASIVAPESESFTLIFYRVNKGLPPSQGIGWGIRFKLQMLCPQEDE